MRSNIYLKALGFLSFPQVPISRNKEKNEINGLCYCNVSEGLHNLLWGGREILNFSCRKIEPPIENMRPPNGFGYN